MTKTPITISNNLTSDDSAFVYKRVKLSECYVPKHTGYDSYQRELDLSHSASMMAHFDPELLRPLVVNYRNGKYVVIDGQHRLSVLTKRNPNGTVDVQVLKRKATIRREAELFLNLARNTRSVPVLDQHFAAVVAREPMALSVQAALTSSDYLPGKRFFHAIGTLNTIYGLPERAVPGAVYGEALIKLTLAVTRAAWPDNEAPPKSIVLAIARLIHRNGEVIQPQSILAAKLGKLTTNEVLELAAAEGPRNRANGDRHSTDMVHALVKLYNEGMGPRSNARLPKFV